MDTGSMHSHAGSSVVGRKSDSSLADYTARWRWLLLGAPPRVA